MISEIQNSPDAAALDLERVKSHDILRKALLDPASPLNQSDRTFGRSLLDQFAKKGTLSVAQWLWVGKLAERAGKVPAPLPVIDGIFEAFMNSTETQAQFPKALFSVQGGAVRLTKINSPKLGAYLKVQTATVEKPKAQDWSYAGFITSKNAAKLVNTYGIPAATLMTALKDFTADPKAAFAAFGLATGICGCCGRTLTDPKSIAIGIGPVCLARL